MNKSTLVPREELSDLDWLARNVTDSHMCDWYIKVADGYSSMTGGTPTGMSGTWCSRKQIIQRRAELQNKPSWNDAPEWVEWMAQHESGFWCWGAGAASISTPEEGLGTWWSAEIGTPQWTGAAGEVLGDWRDTLEKRPEEFKPFTSIEDNQEKAMKQDNGWFERGELPPVGVVCEAYIDRPPQWIEAEIVAHKDGFAIGWCKSVMKGCHGDKASEFRPIRTEREVLIEIIKKTDDTDDRIADAILAAGFKRGAA